MKNSYTLTIVIPTLGRTREIDELLNSIYRYLIRDITIEIIIIDQNYSDILDTIIAKYQNIQYPITHYKVAFRGLSKAKNYGVKHAHGKYICFVDDDAEFLKNTINMAIEILEHGECEVVSGKCIDRNGKSSVLKFKDEYAFLSLHNFENRFVESTMFFKRELFQQFQYDEEMGAGAFYGAEEGYDLVYRMLMSNIRIFYNPNLLFYHPQTILDYSSKVAIRRAFTYRCGYGHLCKKHGFQKKYWKRVFGVIFYIVYLFIFNREKCAFYLSELMGLFVGKFV